MRCQYLTESLPVLQWLPPLIFTIVNEATGETRVALITLTAFFLAGALLLGLGCNVQRQHEKTQKTLGARRFDAAAEPVAVQAVVEP